MRFIIFLVAWFILLAMSWPLALFVLLLAPFIWLVALPFRLVGLVVEALFALVRAVLLLPARILGYRG